MGSLKGCAIIRPTSHETIEHIKQCGDDVLNHDDIPTAYNVEKVVAEIKEANKNEVYAGLCPNGFVHCLTTIDIVRKGGVE
mgnify:CR=1 FL=1